MWTTIVSLFATVVAAQQPAKWTVHEQLRIGSVDDSAQALTRIGDILLGPDGRLYIAQPADLTIRVFDGEGRRG